MSLRNNIRIYLLGHEGLGWSLDRDQAHLETALIDLGYRRAKRLWDADVIYAVSWNALLNSKYRMLHSVFKNLRIVATIANDLTHQESEVDRLEAIVDRYVCANTKQKRFLTERGIPENRLFYSPFYVDEKIFRPLPLKREEIASKLGVDYSLVAGRFLIGSFQRDSLGADLSKPKWQKNPDLLIEFTSGFKKDEVLLVLAGPRRHYLVNQCEERGLPYLFVGDIRPIRENADDMDVNILSLEKMNLLYNLIDLYVVSSSSEGGPKAVIEAALTKTWILSTDVGMAADLLDERCMYKDSHDACRKTHELLGSAAVKESIIEKNLETVSKINNYPALKERMRKLIAGL